MAELGTAKTTHSAALMDCPACGKVITARVSMDLTPKPQVAADGDTPPLVPKSIQLTGTLTGLSIDHDCIPMATR